MFRIYNLKDGKLYVESGIFNYGDKFYHNRAVWYTKFAPVYLKFEDDEALFKFIAEKCESFNSEKNFE